MSTNILQVYYSLAKVFTFVARNSLFSSDRAITVKFLIFHFYLKFLFAVPNEPISTDWHCSTLMSFLSQ